MSTPELGEGITCPDELPDSAEFFAQLADLDQVSARGRFKAMIPVIARAGVGTRASWREDLSSAVMSKRTFDAHMKQADDDARDANRAGDPRRGDPRPDHNVNVSSRNPYRYSLGGAFGRAMFERVRDDGADTWVLRASLPYVHVRVVRRDGTRRRVDTEYLISAEQDGPRVLVGEDDLTEGRWARKIGANLSSDRDIIAAVGTAIRDIAHRFAPEKEAVAQLDAHTENGHLDIPVAECLPAGYLTMPPGVTAEQARQAWRELVEILAKRPSMALVLGSSVGAPFVGPLRRQSHWVDLYGDSQKGKTTTQAVAAAVWGDPTIGAGIVAGWDATSIGLGRLLGQLGTLPAFLDERKVAPYPRDKWGEVIYATCQGSSRLKAEANTAQGTHKAASWFGVLFSTGNHRLTDGIASGGFAGIPPRVLELSAPFTANQAEAKRVAELLRGCYGWLGQAIMETYTLPMVRERIADAEMMVGVPECGSVPGTIAEHLHMAVAGAIMADELLGTGSALTSAALLAAVDHLEVHGHEPIHDADRMVEALGESLSAQRPAWPTLAEYEELERPRPERNAAGYIEPRETQLAQRGYDRQPEGVQSDDGRWLYVYPKTWARMAEELGTDSAVACAELYKRGHLHVPDSYRKRGEWVSEARIIGSKSRVYQVAMTAIDGEPTPETDPEPPSGPGPDPEPIPAGPPDTGRAEPVGAELSEEDQLTAEVMESERARTERAAHDSAEVAHEQASCDLVSPEPEATPSRSRSDPRPEPEPFPQPEPEPFPQPEPEPFPQPEPEPFPQPEPEPFPQPEPEPEPASEPEPERAKVPASEARPRKATPGSSLAYARAALAEGRSPRILAALEDEYAPRRRCKGKPPEPYWRPRLPGMTFATDVITSWEWERPYSGEVAVLDRSGAYVAAASSVLVAHGKLEHTGPCEFHDRPGYYLVQVHPWHESNSLPHPLGEWGSKQPEVWIPAPAVALLRDLADAGRWPDVTVLDSYTGDGVRLSKWAGFVNTLRAEAIAEHGRDSDQYAAVKTGFGMALSLMLGYQGDAMRREWKCNVRRPDWAHSIYAQSAATLWRWADDCRTVAPGLGPVALRNVDELVIPQAALEIVTITKRSGGRAPLGIDPDGIKLGTFKVKAAEAWKDGA